MAAPKIIIVDDEPLITQLLSKFLSQFDYDIETSNNPKEALEKIKTDNYQVVISDIMMPQMNGLDLLDEIKKHNGLIQVIMMTGYVTMSNILQAFGRGVNNIFFKPFENLDEIKMEVDLSIAKIKRVKDVIKERRKLSGDDNDFAETKTAQ